MIEREKRKSRRTSERKSGKGKGEIEREKIISREKESRRENKGGGDENRTEYEKE